MKQPVAFAYLLVFVPVISFVGWNFAAFLLTMSNTIANAIGVALFVALIVHVLYAIKVCRRPAYQFLQRIMP